MSKIENAIKSSRGNNCVRAKEVQFLTLVQLHQHSGFEFWESSQSQVHLHYYFLPCFYMLLLCIFTILTFLSWQATVVTYLYVKQHFHHA